MAERHMAREMVWIIHQDQTKMAYELGYVCARIAVGPGSAKGDARRSSRRDIRASGPT